MTTRSFIDSCLSAKRDVGITRGKLAVWANESRTFSYKALFLPF